MFIYIIPAIVAALITIVIIRTLTFKSNTAGRQTVEINDTIDENETARKLSEAVKVKTISNIDYNSTDWNEFNKYHKLMEELFPLVHAAMEKEIINGYSLLYHWKGKDNRKKPILITAHMDVVPVEDGTESDWTYGPFSGDIKDGYVWGRGTLDTKIHMIASLEAAENLIRDGFVPEGDIYFAFGHDEEVGGMQGASKIVEHLKSKGMAFDYLIDEGGCVTLNAIGGITKPLALVGIGEKGFANIKITLSGEGGHSAMPPKHSALGLLAKAIGNLENNQCRARLIKPVREFLMRIGPEMGFINRLILSNLWLFKPLFISIFSKSKSGNAMLRTTTAVTMAQASMVPNVLPQKASAVVNFRIIPGETGAGLLLHVKDVNKGLPIEVEPLILEEPSMLSSSDTEGFAKIESITKTLYGDVIVAPYIVMAGTDARKYESICENVYRFTPYLIDNSELGKMHGTNENISIENIKRCTQFFHTLFKQS